MDGYLGPSMKTMMFAAIPSTLHTTFQACVLVTDFERSIFLDSMDVKRNAILALHLVGKTPGQTLAELSRLGVNRRLMNRTLKRYKDTGSIQVKRSGGRKRSD